MACVDPLRSLLPRLVHPPLHDAPRNFLGLLRSLGCRLQGGAAYIQYSIVTILQSKFLDNEAAVSAPPQRRSRPVLRVTASQPRNNHTGNSVVLSAAGGGGGLVRTPRHRPWHSIMCVLMPRTTPPRAVTQSLRIVFPFLFFDAVDFVCLFVQGGGLYVSESTTTITASVLDSNQVVRRLKRPARVLRVESFDRIIEPHVTVKQYH